MGGTAGAAGLGGLQAIGGFVQASQTNKSIRSANASALQANAASAAYLDVKNSTDQSKLAKNYAKFLAKEAALSSAKGTYGSASSSAASMSTILSSQTDSGILDFNTRAQKNANNASTRNQILENSSRYQSPIFAAITAGAQGALMGYQLGNIDFFGSGTPTDIRYLYGPGQLG